MVNKQRKSRKKLKFFKGNHLVVTNNFNKILLWGTFIGQKNIVVVQLKEI
jgi:hypothetical protein